MKTEIKIEARNAILQNIAPQNIAFEHCNLISRVMSLRT